jgi:hypothetical protein
MNAEANLNVEYISVDHVMPYQYNARTHSDDQVAQIAGIHDRVWLCESDPD